MEAISAYNVILGRPTLNQTMAIMSTYSLVIKFPTLHGVEIMQGDHTIAQYCYVNSFWRNVVSESQNVEDLDPREDTDQATPV